MWEALRPCHPEVSVHSCWFHWSQAVYRHVKEYGLRSAYIQQLTIRTYLRELMALPNLPATHIEPAFMEMKVRCPHDDRLQKLLQYMLKTWITSSSRPPASWTTFEQSVRTNNDAKGWHSCLNHNTTHDHLNLYFLVQTLHLEAALLPLQVHLVPQRKLSKKPLPEQAALKEL